MFDKTPSPLLLTTASYRKGGDFMGTERCPDRATAYAISRMEWEGPPLPGEEILPTINPAQGTVSDDRKDPRCPRVVSRTRKPADLK